MNSPELQAIMAALLDRGGTMPDGDYPSTATPPFAAPAQAGAGAGPVYG